MPFKAPQRAVSRVFIHCSASDRPEHDSVDVIRDWHVNGNGWNDVGYHYFIRKDGVLEPGRSLDAPPAAQAPHNTGTIAICLHGLRSDLFTEVQFNTLRELCYEIEDAYPQGTITFHGHNEVAAKSCPVFDYRLILRLNDAGQIQGRVPTGEPVEPPQRPRGTVYGQIARRHRQLAKLFEELDE